ncbi:MAG: hypothetical protein ACI89M_001728 [Chitinophagales bacterium]|jgi:hypothetical protein
MNPIIKNILAVIAGVIVGGLVNMAIISVSGSIIPPPEGVNPEDLESIKANMHLYEAKHFIMPFLAHALGALVGAFIAAYIAVSRKMILALAIGVFFFIGGAMMVSMIPSPMWFNILDLGFAYIPMALLGWFIANRVQSQA